MALTDRDIALFARDAVFQGAKTDAAKRTCAKNALACEAQVLADIRDSGYRITARIRTAVAAELQRIFDESAATSTVPANKLSTLAMVEGGEAKTPTVIDKGVVKEWVGFGWITLRDATDDDRATLPLVTRNCA
jgi:hypothetical protein